MRRSGRRRGKSGAGIEKSEARIPRGKLSLLKKECVKSQG
jgi:hypothetical protein